MCAHAFHALLQTMAALRGKPWCQETLDAALVALREDVNVAPTAPGGRGEYRNSLAASFLFKFYVHVSGLACVKGDGAFRCASG
jgi:xanthine dehydrogenase/oxidase